MKNKTKYIAKPNTTFDEGSWVICVDGPFTETNGFCWGRFCGKIDGKIFDDVVCSIEEFIIEEKIKTNE